MNIVLMPTSEKDLILVKDGRTLKALSNKGLIKYPIDKGYKYIDNTKDAYGNTAFKYRGITYVIKYCSGCFYPYLFKVIK